MSPRAFRLLLLAAPLGLTAASWAPDAAPGATGRPAVVNTPFRRALRHFADLPGIAALEVKSRFHGHRSAVDRDLTDGQPAYDYSVHLIKDRSRGVYRLYTGGRWRRSGVPGADGDHVLQHVSRTGGPGTWAMPRPRPEFWLPKEEGRPEVWYAGNCLEPEVLKVEGTYYLYAQVQGSRRPALPGDQEPRGVDRIVLFTGADGDNWTRASTERGVVTNLDDPAHTSLHHQEVIHVPWDADGRPFWMYVAADVRGRPTGYSRLRSADPTTFDWAVRERGGGLAQYGNQIGYARRAPGGPLFVRITFARGADRRLVPALQLSRDGLRWVSAAAEGPVLLEGSEDEDRNRNCYFLGLSTLDGTGELEQAGPSTFRALYGATTCSRPVAPDIFHSEIGIGELELNLAPAAGGQNGPEPLP